MDYLELEHPEKQDNEVYMGNMTYPAYHSMNYSTKRQGLVAYKSNGDIIHENQEVSPIFVSRIEYDAVMKKFAQMRQAADVKMVL